MPCHLDIALKGLSALKVLKDLSTFKFSFSSINRLNVDTCSRKIKLRFLKIFVYFFFFLSSFKEYITCCLYIITSDKINREFFLKIFYFKYILIKTKIIKAENK